MLTVVVCGLAAIFFMLLDILKVCEERQELGIKKKEKFLDLSQL